MTDSTPAPEQKSEPERPSINLKIFGQELGIDGVHGVWAFAFTVVAGIGVVLFLLGVYPQTAEVIGKNFFGGGSRGAHDGQVSEKGPRERVFFWIGENDNYAQNVRRFEDWLTESFDWWGKQSLISVYEEQDGTKIQIKGTEYEVEGPYLKRNRAIQTGRDAALLIEERVNGFFEEPRFWADVIFTENR